MNEDSILKQTCRQLLSAIGENPNREGLKDTPERFEKAWLFWTKG